MWVFSQHRLIRCIFLFVCLFFPQPQKSNSGLQNKINMRPSTGRNTIPFEKPQKSDNNKRSLREMEEKENQEPPEKRRKTWDDSRGGESQQSNPQKSEQGQYDYQDGEPGGVEHHIANNTCKGSPQSGGLGFQSDVRPKYGRGLSDSALTAAMEKGPRSFYLYRTNKTLSDDSNLYVCCCDFCRADPKAARFFTLPRQIEEKDERTGIAFPRRVVVTLDEKGFIDHDHPIRLMGSYRGNLQRVRDHLKERFGKSVKLPVSLRPYYENKSWLGSISG
jgi:hypothetical protein